MYDEFEKLYSSPKNTASSKKTTTPPTLNNNPTIRTRENIKSISKPNPPHINSQNSTIKTNQDYINNKKLYNLLNNAYKISIDLNNKIDDLENITKQNINYLSLLLSFTLEENTDYFDEKLEPLDLFEAVGLSLESICNKIYNSIKTILENMHNEELLKDSKFYKLYKEELEYHFNLIENIKIKAMNNQAKNPDLNFIYLKVDSLLDTIEYRIKSLDKQKATIEAYISLKTNLEFLIPDFVGNKEYNLVYEKIEKILHLIKLYKISTNRDTEKRTKKLIK